MGVIATAIIITSLYLLIQGAILFYRKRYLIKLPYVYVKEVQKKRRIRKDIKHLREAFHKLKIHQ